MLDTCMWDGWGGGVVVWGVGGDLGRGGEGEEVGGFHQIFRLCCFNLQLSPRPLISPFPSIAPPVGAPSSSSLRIAQICKLV